MFLTQVWGTVLGGFVSYVVMISIVTGNRELLADGDGNSSWSGATIQSYNTNATSWALASKLYKLGAQYQLVPFGLLVGAGLVILHRIFYKVRAFAYRYASANWRHSTSSYLRLVDSTSPTSTCHS